tara:strand:+ start:5973 stop:6362 length:390 start_codon:yes stop_codon:yes gene_type:complete
MNMTKRQLNKKLKTSLLRGNDGGYIRNLNVRVTRARQVNPRWGRPYTEVDITVHAEVQCVNGGWRGCHTYGIKDIRTFLRREYNGVGNLVSSWTRLWGFPTSVKLKTIKFGKDSSCTDVYPPKKRYHRW